MPFFEASGLILIVLAQRLHATAAIIGIIFSMFGIGGVAGAIVAPWARRRLTLSQIVIGGTWVWALLWPLFAIVPHPLILGAITAVMALVGAAWNVALGSYTLGLIPDALRGRVRSVSLLIAWGSIPLGAVLSGFLLQLVGPISAVLITAGAMVGLAAAATLSSDLRKTPSTEAGQPG